jgi:ribosomal-protein-alanine N-acetyltransferase
MIKGERVVLRTVRQADLDTLYTLVSDVESRGPHMRHHLRSEPEFRKLFEETGFFDDTQGRYLVTDRNDRILGDIGYFSVNYMDGYEIGYCLYDTASRGKGVMTEALTLVVRNLFDTRKINRLQIATAPDNEPSKRLALRCGFRLEGTLRGHIFHRGRSEDSLLYSLLRSDLDA